MNLVPRQDRVLAVGLAVGLVVVFARPIGYLFEVVHDVERASGLTLGPALVILTAVFLYHHLSKRQEAAARAAVAEANAAQSRARAADIAWLVTFGHALGRAADIDAIHDAVQEQLPQLSGAEGAWVLVRTGGHWESLTRRSGAPRREDDAVREEVAARAMTDERGMWSSEALRIERHLCLPMVAGGHGIGVLAIPEAAGPFSDARRRTLSAAASLLAIALRNVQLLREVRDNGVRDTLTGCINRSHALEVIDTELRRARRSQMPVSMIMFDLDHFQEVNERYGRMCGDAVLAAVGTLMRDALRGSDMKCRYGGEEFLVLLPETPLDGAKRVADTLRREIASMRVPWNEALIAVTASFGVTVALPSEIDADAVISRADAALYRAKDQGRDCVRLSLETAVA